MTENDLGLAAPYAEVILKLTHTINTHIAEPSLMLEKQRHKLLLDILREQHFVSARSLAEQLNASEATIRRDITKLAKENQLNKIRGGAEAINKTEFKFQQIPVAGSVFLADKERHTQDKRAIAKKAVELCDESDLITINAGSSTYMMGEFLRDTQMSILTNSFSLAHDLIENTNNQITIPGGEIYRKQNIILSAFEDDMIQHYRVSKMFIGSPGVSHYGVMESDPLLIRAEQKLMKQADKVVVLADSSKLGQRSNFILCPLEQVDILITDNKVSQEHKDLLEEHGIEVVIA